MSLVKKGNDIRVHYVGTFSDGTEFDNSRERGDTIDFKVGAGNLLNTFEDQMLGMKVGDVKTFTIDNAYGDPDERAVMKVPMTSFPGGMQLEEGMMVQGFTPEGRPMAAIVVDFDKDGATLDHNHPHAGKDLTFEVELMEIVDKEA
tara:strand:- start:4053 stop:4490 length:438 start_codon:yes stop_codon:yes gene_type:complete